MDSENPEAQQTRDHQILSDRSSGMTLRAIGTKHNLSAEGVRQIITKYKHHVSDPVKMLYKPWEVAEMLGISKATVYQMAATKQIRSIKIGKALRISQAAIDDWIVEQEAQS